MAAAQNTHGLERVPTTIVEEKAYDVVSQALTNVTNDIVSNELIKNVLSDVQAQELNKAEPEEFDDQSEIYTQNRYVDDVAALCDTMSVSDEDEVDDVVVSADETDSHITGRNSQQRIISIEILSREAILHHEQAESDEEEEEQQESGKEGEDMDHEETDQEFVIRRSFENYSNYTVSSCRALEAYLTEKRFLQLLREAQLMGIGKQFNTTDAEMCYFRNVVNNRRGLFFKDFAAALEDIKNRLPGASIEEALTPLTDVHYQPKDMMGTGHYLIHDRPG